MVGARRIELRRIRIAGARYFRNAGNAGFRTAGVIEQDAITDAHVVAHEIARLVVTHAGPGQRALRRSERMIDARLVGLGFHQPVTHGIDGGARTDADDRANEKAVAMSIATAGRESRLCRCAGILNLTVQGGHSSSILGSSDERRSRLLNESRSQCA